jgi:hypothetical protein
MSFPAPIDSFLEARISSSEFYEIWVDSEQVGLTAVHEENLVTFFALYPPFRKLGQDVFREIRRLEKVQAALVPTCDEFFLSHAMDEHWGLRVQGYYFVSGGELVSPHPNPCTLRRAGIGDIVTIQRESDDFFQEVPPKVAKGQLYVASRNGETTGFGILEHSQLCGDVASLGMFVLEQFRKQGVATEIVRLLIEECVKFSLRPVAGCWRYNHGSKKALEGAGMITQSRLLRIDF